MDNGHAHLFYGLDIPIHDYHGASEKALRYCAAVDVAMTELLKADPGYAKLLSKNPLHDRWLTVFPCSELYTLDDLAQYLDLDKYRDRRRRLPAIGYGRNCTLFEQLRRWAYRARRDPFLSEEMFYHAVHNHGLMINSEFTPPLPHSEVRATAKSIAKWTWRRMSAEGYEHFMKVKLPEIQRCRSMKAAAKRTAKAQDLKQRIIETAYQCPALTQTDIAILMGVTQQCVSKHLKGIQHTRIR